jgi:hypothetical protein
MPKIKVIIAGGRDFDDFDALEAAFQEFLKDYENKDVTIISGMARGADMLGVRIAEEYTLPLIKMPADWDQFGKAAGHIRNAEMARIGTHLLAAWDGVSKGTKGMIGVATKKNLTIKIIGY